MSTHTKYITNIYGGAIDYYYESEGFWDGKDQTLDDKLDLEYCKKQLIRYAVNHLLDIDDDWDEICDQAYEILAAEYEFAMECRIKENLLDKIKTDPDILSK
jgi:hypothetical protein